MTDGRELRSVQTMQVSSGADPSQLSPQTIAAFERTRVRGFREDTLGFLTYRKDEIINVASMFSVSGYVAIGNVSTSSYASACHVPPLGDQRLFLKVLSSSFFFFSFLKS